LVQTDEQDRVIIVEDLLCAVSMMDIPVDNGKPLNPILALGVPCCDRDVVEQTESHHLRRFSVMTRWSHSTKSAREIPCDNLINSLKNTPGRKNGNVVGILAHVCVGIVQQMLTAMTSYFDHRRVSFGMDEIDYL
jgi:hypothetical protein